MIAFAHSRNASEKFNFLPRNISFPIQYAKIGCRAHRTDATAIFLCSLANANIPPVSFQPKFRIRFFSALSSSMKWEISAFRVRMASFYLDADELKGAMNNVRLLFLEFPLTLALLWRRPRGEQKNKIQPQLCDGAWQHLLLLYELPSGTYPPWTAAYCYSNTANHSFIWFHRVGTPWPTSKF